MNALITGASGVVGTQLRARLEDPVLTSRSPSRLTGYQVMQWPLADGSEPPPKPIDTVFHLAGEPVGEGRWTRSRMDRILNSRVEGTRGLVDWMSTLEHRPSVLVCASAIGFYGDRGDESLTESSAFGTGFLADVCRAWEAEAMRASDLGIRVVCARIGIVLTTKGGALAKMLTPFRMGLGGPLGTGRQWMSWVHIDDVVGLLLHAAKTPIQGPMNVVAPTPVQNHVFTRTLGKTVSRPTIFRAPRFALKGALGKMAEIVLASQRVIPEQARTSGYQFEHPELYEALMACLGE